MIICVDFPGPRTILHAQKGRTITGQTDSALCIHSYRRARQGSPNDILPFCDICQSVPPRRVPFDHQTRLCAQTHASRPQTRGLRPCYHTSNTAPPPSPSIPPSCEHQTPLLPLHCNSDDDYRPTRLNGSAPAVDAETGRRPNFSHRRTGPHIHDPPARY